MKVINSKGKKTKGKRKLIPSDYNFPASNHEIRFKKYVAKKTKPKKKVKLHGNRQLSKKSKNDKPVYMKTGTFKKKVKKCKHEHRIFHKYEYSGEALFYCIYCLKIKTI